MKYIYTTRNFRENRIGTIIPSLYLVMFSNGVTVHIIPEIYKKVRAINLKWKMYILFFQKSNRISKKNISPYILVFLD